MTFGRGGTGGIVNRVTKAAGWRLCATCASRPGCTIITGAASISAAR